MERRDGRRRMAALLALLLSGCTLGPKGFLARDLGDPAPLVRARAVTLGDKAPTSVVVPVLLDRMNDPDAVVRLTAHEELRKRTGQDFGYHPWDDFEDRARAIGRWRVWWAAQTRGPALARAQSL